MRRGQAQRTRQPGRDRQSAQQAYEAGRTAGFREGRAAGWREGAARAIAGTLPLPAGTKRPLRIVYVPQGFDAIDEGIVSALRLHAADVHIAEAPRMAETAAALRPDLLLVLNGLHVFPADHLAQIDRVRGLGIRTAIWFADDPYVTAETVRIAPRYDTVITHELGTVDFYRSHGCQDVHYLPFAADPARFKPEPVPAAYRSDVCFIGQAFWNRVETFDAIAGELAGLRVFIAGGLWERMKRYGMLRHAIRPGWLPVDESVRYYNGAKIVINLHRTAVPGSDNANSYGLPARSINPRTFEIAGCGAFQLTDRREDLERHYRPGVELDTYDSPAELAMKIRHYLHADDERNAIAARALARTLREHTYAARVGTLLERLGFG